VTKKPVSSHTRSELDYHEGRQTKEKKKRRKEEKKDMHIYENQLANPIMMKKG